jgi:hypothetical protein
MMKLKFSVLAWISGLMTNPINGDQDQLSDARILKLTKEKISPKYKTSRTILIFGASSLLITSGLGLAVAISNSDAKHGDASTGVVCWVGGYGTSTAVQIGSDISPIDRCATILESHFDSDASAPKLQGCVAATGVINILRKQQSCASIFMKELAHNYPFSSIDIDQARSIVEQIMAANPCQNSQALEAEVQLSLRQADLLNWKVVATVQAGRSKCSLATLLPRMKTVQIIPGDSR